MELVSETETITKDTKKVQKKNENYKDFLADRELLIRKLNNVLPNFDADIEDVANVIMHTIDTDTRKAFIERVDETFASELKHIILTQNQILNMDAHPIGIEISNHFNSTSAQSILNVKHLSVVNSSVKYIVPSLNSIILHQQTDNKTWFRLRCSNVNAVMKKISDLMMDVEFIVLNDEILEVVYTSDIRSGLANERTYYDLYKNVFDADPNVIEIIFYSNCRCLMDIETSNYNLIYSNIFKFYYCHHFNKLDTTYSPVDLESVIFLQIQCYMLMLQQNFNTNNSKVLEPLTLLASEKNNAALNATQNHIYATDAIRDTHILGEGSSIGGKNKAKLTVVVK